MTKETPVTRPRNQQGATLALVVTITFLVIMIGVGFVVWLKLLGGGAELQHATDSGNLNVVVKVLKKPGITLNQDEALEFGDLVADSDGEVNLLNFNKLVAKVALAQANAASELKAGATSAAKDHADALVKMLEGSGGIADRLYTKLSDHENLKGFFNSLSQSNSTRMLTNSKENNQVDNASGTSVAYCVPGKASNIWINPNSVPEDVRADFLDKNTTSKFVNDGRSYLKGYNTFALTNYSTPVSLWGVPMRPGEQPHLIGLDEFQKRTVRPDLMTGNVEGKIIPNAFKSEGASNPFAGALLMKSAALVGTLSAEFPAKVPAGVLVVDNRAPPAAGTDGGANVDVWQQYLMRPKCVDVLTMTMRSGTKWDYLSETPYKFNDLIDAAKATYRAPGTAQPLPSYVPFDNAVIDKVIPDRTSPSGLNGDDIWRFHALGVDPQYVSQFPGRNDWPVSYQRECCDNINSIASNPGSSSICVSHLKDILSIYGGGSDRPTEFGNLMAVEEFGREVNGAGPGDDGCALVWAPGGLGGTDNCTPLKQYDHNKTYTSDLPFNTQDGRGIDDNRLGTVIDQGGGSDIKTRIAERLRQMNPTASESSINSVFDLKVKWNDLSFIFAYNDGYTISYTTQPSNLGTLTPDGADDNAANQFFNVLYTMVDVPGSRWEAPPQDGAWSQDKLTWIPSSGYKNLLGVLRMRNCTRGGGNWCSP